VPLVEHLRSKIVGQDDASQRFAQAIERGERLARPPASPRSVSLLLGPTGVGKTEIILEAGRFLFGETYRGLCRFDMGEFSQPESVSRLLGTSTQPSPLEAAFTHVGSLASSIMHFDEIEKAHRDVIKLFLGINDAARLTLSNGRQLDFSRCHLVFTSNLGGREAAATDELPYESIEKNVLRAAEHWFSPELLQRFRSKIVFISLSYDAQLSLCRRLLRSELSLQGAHLGRLLRASEDVVRFVLDQGYTKQYGARALKNTISTLVGDALLPFAAVGQNNNATDIFSTLLTLEVPPEYDRLVARAGECADLYS